MVAIGFGQNADMQVLGDMTEHVYNFQDTDPAAYAQFFRWISQSVKSSSIAVNDGKGDGINLSKIGEEVLKKVDFSAIQARRPVDDRYAVILAKCQKTQKPYLIKYALTQRPGDAWLSGLNVKTREYRLQGAYPVDNQYFDLSNGQEDKVSIHTNELVGFPLCPYCSNPYGFSGCSCGGIFCSGDETVSTCPWCHNEIQMSAGEGGFNVNRTAG